MFALLIGVFSNVIQFHVCSSYIDLNIYLLMATISIENISGRSGTAAFLAYLSKLTNTKYTATQLLC